MRKKVALLLMVILTGGLVACGQAGVPQNEYDELLKEKDAIEEELTELKSSHDELKQELDSIQQEYDNYKDQMKPYEELSIAEAEAAKAKAEQEKAEADAAAKAKAEEEAAAAAAKKAEEEAAAAAEEAKGYETGITYDQLARTPGDYEGKKVKFRGRVVQVIEGADEIQIRLAVNDDDDTIILCGYEPKVVTSRVLEDDYITIYGISIGLISYESTLGGQITIPGVYVERIDQ